MLRSVYTVGESCRMVSATFRKELATAWALEHAWPERRQTCDVTPLSEVLTSFALVQPSFRLSSILALFTNFLVSRTFLFPFYPQHREVVQTATIGTSTFLGPDANSADAVRRVRLGLTRAIGRKIQTNFD